MERTVRRADRVASRMAIACLVAMTMCAMAHEPALAANAAPALPQLSGLDGLAASLSKLLSVQLVIGFGLGLLAGEAGRVAWTAGLGAWRSLLTFATLVSRYGVVAGLLGAVLYFI